MSKDLLQGYCKTGLENRMDGAQVIDPRSVVTAEWVRMKCQFGCPGYSMRLCCPPFTPMPEVTRKVLDSYQKAIMFHRKLKKGPDGDVKGMAQDFNRTLFRLEREIFLQAFS